MKGFFTKGIIEFFKSAFQSSSSQPVVPPEEGSSDYEKKLRNEQRFYKDCTNVHQLPDIFHYWSNKYLAPELHRFGFTNPDELFSFYIEKYLADKSGQTTRVLSIGSGNCDLELEISRKLVEQGHKDFVIECLDLNQDMLERGTNAVNDAGLGDCFVFTRADFNKWNPTAKYGIVLANQSLHHVLNLEGLFDSVKQSLEPDGLFLISDMIGRNGHMRWPEAMKRLEPFWDQLPESYRYNQLIKRHEQQYINHDCSTDGFEGIRAQDILPLLLERFNFDFFFPFGNMIFVFIDRPFGHNFDADAEWDRDFIDRVHAQDEAYFISGELKPTSMLAVLTCSESATVLRHPVLTPQYCVRPPGQIVEGTAKQSRDEKD
jgi:SAM-dependent methyltransferase